MCIYIPTYAWVPTEARKGTLDPLELRVIGGCKLPEYSCWDQNAGLLKEQQAPFTTEPCIQSRHVIFVTLVSWWGWKGKRGELDIGPQLFLLIQAVFFRHSVFQIPTTSISSHSICFVDICLPHWGTSDMERIRFCYTRRNGCCIGQFSESETRGFADSQGSNAEPWEQSQWWIPRGNRDLKRNGKCASQGKQAVAAMLHLCSGLCTHRAVTERSVLTKHRLEIPHSPAQLELAFPQLGSKGSLMKWCLLFQDSQIQLFRL